MDRYFNVEADYCSALTLSDYRVNFRLFGNLSFKAKIIKTHLDEHDRMRLFALAASYRLSQLVVCNR